MASKKYMVIDNGDVISPAMQSGVFETYESAKSFAESHNAETAEYHARYSLKAAYVIAVDARNPYATIGNY